MKTRSLLLSVVLLLAVLLNACSLSNGPITAGPDMPIVGTTFQSPVTSTKSFEKQAAWIVSEPGVLLDDTAAFTITGTDAKYFVNVPEGGFTYFSLGEGKIKLDNVEIVLEPQNGLIYLVLVRGTLDDGIVDSDLNGTAELTDFVPGHAIYSHMPTGAYVSADWFHDQLVAATTNSFTACGATGCSNARVVLFDRSSHKYQMFAVNANNVDLWFLIESN